MKIKRISALLLCIAMLMSSAFADTAQAQRRGSEQFQLLSQLGFLPQTLSESYDPEKAITKGDFAAITANCLNLRQMGQSTAEPVFSDVSENNANYEAIGLCVGVGLISGDGEGMFHPTRKITFAQAVKILMSALGFDELAAQKGGYPVGYMICAAESRVVRSTSLSDNATLTAADAYQLICNAIDTSVLKQTSFGEGVREFDNESGETILSLYHNTYKFEGQLRATSESSFVDIEPLDKDEILIDKSIYKTSADCTQLLGQQIYYYFNDSTETVVAAVPKSTATQTLTVAAEDIIAFSDNTLKYANGDKISEAKLSRSAEIIYNSRPATDMTDSDFVIKSGEIRLLESSGDKLYDAAVISSADSYMIRKSDAYNEIFYDLYDSEKSFCAKDMEKIVFRDEFGDDMSLSELSKYDVVSVLLSRDKKYAVLYYSNSEAEGSVESREISGDTVRLIVGGKSYGVSENYRESAMAIQPGEQGIFVLDVYGNIAGCKPYDSTNKWGYLIATDKKSALGGEVSAKLLSESGEITLCRLSKNISVDGKMMSDTDAHNILQTAANGQLVRYYMTNGELKYIDTVQHADGESDDTMTPLFSGYDGSRNESVKLMWNRYQQILGSKVPVGSQAKIFRVPPKLSGNDEDYKALTPSFFQHDTSYYVDAYRTGNTSHAAQAVMIYKDGSVADTIDSTVEATVVDYISRTVDDEGKMSYVLHGLREGKKVSNIVHKDSLIDELKSIVTGNTDKKHTLVCGDIVKLAIDPVTQEITTIALYYERENDFIKSNTPVGTNTTASDRMLKANVYAEDNANLWLTQDELSSPGIELTIDDIESVQANLYKIYRFGIGKDSKPEAVVSSASEITDYKSNPTAFSRLVMLSRYNNPGVIVIYE